MVWDSKGMTKIESQLFSAKKHALEKEYERCPDCGSELIIKHSAKGSFLGCKQYPACQYLRPLTKQKENIADQMIQNSHCPICDKPLVVKSGKYGAFISCSDHPHCQYIEKNHIQNSSEKVRCPQCKMGFLESRTNRYGKTFYACNCYPKCKFIVNYRPYPKECPDCGFGILVERTLSTKHYLMCPQKGCKYKLAIDE